MPQINTDEWCSEINAIIAASNINGPIIDDHGFTVYDIMANRIPQLSRETAMRIIKKYKNDGKIKHVGYRSGRNGAKVYEVIKDDIKE
jgi:hypothetical protein